MMLDASLLVSLADYHKAFYIFSHTESVTLLKPEKTPKRNVGIDRPLCDSFRDQYSIVLICK